VFFFFGLLFVRQVLRGKMKTKKKEKESKDMFLFLAKCSGPVAWPFPKK